MKKSLLNLEYIPKRIISLVPSQTELLYDLGLTHSIVGVTKFCVHPSDAKKTKKVVGGTKNINIKKIKALHPDIILCNKEENTKEIVASCLEIATTHVSDIYTLEDTKNLIAEYGILFSKTKEASDISKKISEQQKEFEIFIKNKPMLKVAYFIWRKPWMVAAGNTFIDHLLKVNKFQNIYGHLSRYPGISLVSMMQKEAPDLIFLSSEPFPFKEKHVLEIRKHNNHSTIVFVNGEMFSWYGSRLIKAFEYFKQLRLSLE